MGSSMYEYEQLHTQGLPFHARGKFWCTHQQLVDQERKLEGDRMSGFRKSEKDLGDVRSFLIMGRLRLLKAGEIFSFRDLSAEWKVFWELSFLCGQAVQDFGGRGFFFLSCLGSFD